MTILGLETVAELRELVAAKDYAFGQMEKAYVAAESGWKSKDPKAFEDWKSDWSTLKLRYAAARALAESAFTRSKLSLASESVIPAELEYRAVLKSLTLHPEKGYQKGDFQDVFNRLAAVTTVDMSKSPQPRDSDFDLDARKTLGKVDITDKENRGTAILIGGSAAALAVALLLSRR